MELRSKYLVLFGLFLLLITSCSNDFIINESKRVDNLWQTNNTIGFDFQILDTVSSYSFFINIRNSTNYDYSNIYFFISTTFPDEHQSKDTVECILANIRGKWLGKGMNNIKESSHLISKKLHFPKSGIYNMQIEQAMRVDALKGIKNVGIKIVKNID